MLPRLRLRQHRPEPCSSRAEGGNSCNSRASETTSCRSYTSSRTDSSKAEPKVEPAPPPKVEAAPKPAPKPEPKVEAAPKPRKPEQERAAPAKPAAKTALRLPQASTEPAAKAAPSQGCSGKTRADKKAESQETIRVQVSLLDKLMNLAGELVLVEIQKVLRFATNEKNAEFSKLAQKVNLVTTEIQNEVMKTRMQPVGSILSKFNICPRFGKRA